MAVNSLVTSSTPTSVSLTAAAANTFYSSGTLNLTPGIYRISCISTTNATLYFLSNGSSVGSAVTVNGTIDVNIGSTITNILYSTNTGSNIIITIQYLASSISSTTISGTLDTITTGSGTYTQTGNAFVVVVGGGGSGAFANSGWASGGGSGGITGGSVVLTGNIAYSVGAKGAKQTVSGNNGNAGGSTTFGSLTAGGGGAGLLGTSNPNNGGSPGGGRGGYGSSNPGLTAAASDSSPFSFVISGTTGGGGYGTVGQSRGAGAGSGIGSGGTGGQGGTAEAATNATGYGAGGGAGATTQPPGEATGGVIYVFRY